MNDLKIDWAKDANINKIDNCKTITVTKDKDSLELKLNEEEDKVILKTITEKTYEHLAKKEKGKINIYRKSTNDMNKNKDDLYSEINELNTKIDLEIKNIEDIGGKLKAFVIFENRT